MLVSQNQGIDFLACHVDELPQHAFDCNGAPIQLPVKDNCAAAAITQNVGTNLQQRVQSGWSKSVQALRPHCSFRLEGLTSLIVPACDQP